MSNKLHADGIVSFTIAVSDKLALYSKDAVKIYKINEYTNHPNTKTLLATAEAGVEYLSAAFTVPTVLSIETSSAIAYYQSGTNPAVIERRGARSQGAPGVLDATGALTAAMMGAGIVTSAAATVAGTVPTGTVLDASLEMEIGESFDWSLIKLGANDFTVTAATGHTLVGVAVVSTATTGVFRTRKTAAATYVTYRVG